MKELFNISLYQDAYEPGDKILMGIILTKISSPFDRIFTAWLSLESGWWLVSISSLKTVIVIPNLTSLVVQEFVVTTSSGETSDNKFGVNTNIDLQCLDDLNYKE